MMGGKSRSATGSARRIRYEETVMDRNPECLTDDLWKSLEEHGSLSGVFEEMRYGGGTSVSFSDNRGGGISWIGKVSVADAEESYRAWREREGVA